MVFSQLRRAQANARGGWALWFWRDRASEADFLSHRGGRFDLADAKFKMQPSNRDVEPLRRIASSLPEGSVRSLAILCRTAREYPLGPGARALPVDAPWPPDQPWP